MAHKLALITDFFDSIGLDYVITDVRADSFMTGLDIVNCVLHIDENTLPYEEGRDQTF